MVPLLVITGESGSGKTTLIAGIVRNLASRGYKIGVIKHSPRHPGLDEEGKDTWIFSRAGASITCLAAESQLYIVKGSDSSLAPEELLPNFPGMDLVLAEGYKQRAGEGTPVIEVIKDGQRVRYSSNPLAVIRRLCPDGHTAAHTPCFQRDDIAEISAFIEERLISISKEEKPHA